MIFVYGDEEVNHLKKKGVFQKEPFFVDKAKKRGKGHRNPLALNTIKWKNMY